MPKFHFDKILLSTTVMYYLFGFAMFFSASLGVMIRYEEKFYNVISNQFFYGILLGTVALLCGILIHYKFWRNLSFVLYSISFLLCLLVFIPSLGVEINGSKSWLSLFGFTFQPSEILKYSSVLFLAAFYSKFKARLNENIFKFIPFRILPIVILSISSATVLLQPDIGTGIIIIVGIAITFFVLAANLKDIFYSTLAVTIILSLAYISLPHIRDRVSTFLNPTSDILGSSYQINQAAISFGSGGIYGDGYGASTQKYHHLPEPIGDSIFAVIGEELGFVGTLSVIFIILFLCFRLFYIAQSSVNLFEKGVLSGTASIILVQSFLNIGSISGATPLTGVPLPLVSHGSTSLIITLGMLGLCIQLAGRHGAQKSQFKVK
jgi:cell division protein FtsW